MTTKTVVYISYDGLSDSLGRSQILPYIMGLESLGHRFCIVSAEKPAAMASQQPVVRQLIQHKHINWIPVVYHKRPPVFSTLYDLYRLYRAASRCIRQEKATLLHSRSYTGALLGLWLSRRYKIPFVFDMRGFWPDERVEGGLWMLSNPVYRIIYHYFKRMERILLSEADAIVTLTKAAADQIAQWHIVPRRPPVVIPCCVDTDAFPLPDSQPSTTRKHLVYLGSLGTWYLLPEMMAFYKVYESFVPGSKFVVLTKEPSEMVLRAAKQAGVPESSVEVKSATRVELPGLLAGAAVSVFFVRPGFSKKGSSATKLAELLSSGIPVVSNYGIGDQDAFFKHYNMGVLVREFSAESYHSAVVELLNTTYAPASLRLLALELFDLKKGVAQYDALYRAL